MASRKAIKKVVNDACYDIVDECFVYQLQHAGEKSDASEALIVKAVTFRNECVTEIQKVKKSSKDAKKKFSELWKEILTKHSEFVEALNKLA